MPAFRESFVQFVVICPDGHKEIRRAKLAHDVRDGGLVIIPQDIPELAGYAFKFLGDDFANARNGRPVERLTLG